MSELRQVGSFDTAGELICPVDKMSVEAINQVLLENTGLTLEETGRIGMDYFQYLPEYDAYYHSHGDTNYFSGVNITAGERVGDTIRLYYRTTRSMLTAGQLRDTGRTGRRRPTGLSPTSPVSGPPSLPCTRRGSRC